MKEWLISIFESVGAKVAAGILAAFSAIAATAVTTPAGDWLKGKVWPERIEVNQSVWLVENRKSRITIVLQDRSASSGIAGGSVTLIPQDDAVVVHGPATFTYEPAEGSVSVPKDGVLVSGRKIGEHRISVDVRSNRGAHFEGAVIAIVQRETSLASMDDLSGDWNVDLRGTHGVMVIGDSGNRRFAGRLELDTQQIFDLMGWYDGVRFSSKLYVPGGERVGSMNGVYCELSQGDLYWIVINAKVKLAEVANDAPTPISWVGETCPGVPASLAGLEGNGAFTATIRSTRSAAN